MSSGMSDEDQFRVSLVFHLHWWLESCLRCFRCGLLCSLQNSEIETGIITAKERDTSTERESAIHWREIRWWQCTGSGSWFHMAWTQKYNDKGVYSECWPCMGILCECIYCVCQMNLFSRISPNIPCPQHVRCTFFQTFFDFEWTGCSSGSLFLFGLSHFGSVLGEILQRRNRWKKEWKVIWYEMRWKCWWNECGFVLILQLVTQQQGLWSGFGTALATMAFRSVFHLVWKKTLRLPTCEGASCNDATSWWPWFISTSPTQIL